MFKDFSIFGLPKVLVCDNGSTFTSGDFKEFAKRNGIFIKLTAPYNPSTNGQAEKFVQTLKNSIKKMCSSNKNVDSALLELLTQYRIMPHVITGKTPSELMFKRKIRNHLDLIIPCKSVKNNVNENIQCRKFNINDRVECRNYVGEKKWDFGRVSKILGKLHYLILLDDGRIRKCHVNQMNKIGEKTVNKNVEFDYYALSDNLTNSSDNCMQTDSQRSNITPELNATVNNSNKNVNKKVEISKSIVELRDRKKLKAPDRLNYK